MVNGNIQRYQGIKEEIQLSCVRVKIVGCLLWPFRRFRELSRTVCVFDFYRMAHQSTCYWGTA